jgi:hypothetical protein
MKSCTELVDIPSQDVQRMVFTQYPDSNPMQRNFNARGLAWFARSRVIITETLVARNSEFEIFNSLGTTTGHAVLKLVEALCFKPAGRGLHSG